jgi:hypothetical protein
LGNYTVLVMASKPNKPQWIYKGSVIDDISKTPKGSLAFIYKITLEDGRYYYGRKTMWKPKFTSGKRKGESKGEYPWKTYNGSSKELLSIIKEGKIKYSKEIINFCFSKAETTYEETKIILCNGGLTDPNCFNFWIKSIIYSKHLKPNT